jgi:diguanylate cyclase (GGDEF)-like protein
MKILIAEDDAVSRRVVEQFLKKWGYDVVSVCDGQAAWELLDSDEAPRIAILDWVMPGVEGVDICRRVRARLGRSYVYLILLTASVEKERLLGGLNAGADDFLTKPFNGEELHARLRVGERILKMQDELIAARDALHFRVSHDTLTGAASRGATMDFLHRELSRGLREGRPTGVVLADLDSFKAINDRHGHQAGDAVLEEVARRMMASVRTYDCVGRYGGEEFLIVLPTADENGTFRQSERIRQMLEATPVRFSNVRIPVTSSFGVAASDGLQRPEISDLIRAVDAALYRAKGLGGNRSLRASQVREPVSQLPHTLA